MLVVEKFDTVTLNRQNLRRVDATFFRRRLVTRLRELLRVVVVVGLTVVLVAVVGQNVRGGLPLACRGI